LVFEFRARNFEPGQVTEVEVLFESAEQGTRVTVEHRGWDTLPSEHPARHGMDDGSFQDMMAIWWADLLASAQRHAAGGPAVRS
jgi:hypothetical protein